MSRRSTPAPAPQPVQVVQPTPIPPAANAPTRASFVSQGGTGGQTRRLPGRPTLAANPVIGRSGNIGRASLLGG